MKAEKIPLVEYDPSSPAIIEPQQVIKNIAAPEHCVLCFFGEVIGELKQKGILRIIANHKWEDMNRPLFEMEVGRKRIGIFHLGVGAPLAAALMEEVIARGCRRFIACGGSGVLDQNIEVGKILIPIAAVRDEGTSYHYLPAGREIQANERVVETIESVLQDQGIEYMKVKTWTTDGPYRETPNKVEMRKADGCLAVDPRSHRGL